MLKVYCDGCREFAFNFESGDMRSYVTYYCGPDLNNCRVKLVQFREWESIRRNEVELNFEVEIEKEREKIFKKKVK